MINNINNPVTHKSKYIDRNGGSNVLYEATVTRTNICKETLNVQGVQTEYNIDWKFIKLSDFITHLQSLYERYGDGYVMSGSNEMTPEFFAITVVDEHIEFLGLPNRDPIVDNRFFSID